MPVSPTRPNNCVYPIRQTASKLGVCSLALTALIATCLWSRDGTAKVAMTPGITRHLLVPVFVNGKGPYNFMLDTSADTSAVYAWFASQQQLPSGKTATISGATSDIEETTTRVESLSLDGRALHHLDVDTIPDRTDGVKIAGIVGADLLMERLTVMDTGCETVSLLPRSINAAAIAGRSATLIKAGSIRNGKQMS